ncbi:MAG: hypothetical protein JWM31_1266 [Solirubrobacterales bacterium]|nr:hypothetical protein [Solirubrobacterales bacterium]
MASGDTIDPSILPPQAPQIVLALDAGTATDVVGSPALRFDGGSAA